KHQLSFGTSQGRLQVPLVSRRDDSDETDLNALDNQDEVEFEEENLGTHSEEVNAIVVEVAPREETSQVMTSMTDKEYDFDLVTQELPDEEPHRHLSNTQGEEELSNILDIYKEIFAEEISELNEDFHGVVQAHDVEDEKEIAEMLDVMTIEKSTSPWC